MKVLDFAYAYKFSMNLVSKCTPYAVACLLCKFIIAKSTPATSNVPQYALCVNILEI
jgi:hypothetical protein